MGIEGYEDHSVRELWGVGVAVRANCGVGGVVWMDFGVGEF